MPPKQDHEEIKVQKALELLKNNPGMTRREACHISRAAYGRVTRRLQGIRGSHTRGGHNKKLAVPQSEALKDHIEMCYAMGRSANIEVVVASANSILRCDGSMDTVSRRWAKGWIKQNHEFIYTLREKPLSAKRRATHIREDIEAHFKEFDRCKRKWGILDDDIYNFDETGCQIGVTSGGLVCVPAGVDQVYVDDPDNKELVTSTECISASGYHLPAMITFKGAYHLRKYFENDMDGDTFWTRSDTGFVNDKLTMKWIEHFEKFTANRTKGRYRMLIFDGYGSHITQNFIDFCWKHRIRPFQLPPHSTHLLQPCDVGAFQSFKHNFKEEVRRDVFLGAKEISKTDFFSFFQRFSDKTFTIKLCKSAFKKAGLIPLNPKVVFDKMDRFGITVEAQNQGGDGSDSDASSEPAFATPPPPPMSEYKTPITNTQRRRGSDYIQERVTAKDITPTVLHVMEKVERGTTRMVHKGKLAQELLRATTAAGEAREARKKAGNKVVQKYGEIYGHQARRQIALDREDELRVVNMRLQREQAPWKKRYKVVMTKLVSVLREEWSKGRFQGCTALEE